MPTIAEAFPDLGPTPRPVVHQLKERHGQLYVTKCGADGAWSAWSQEITCAECQGHGMVSP